MSAPRPTKTLGLPAHWRRGRLVAALLAFGVAALTTFALRDIGRADRLDGWWLRARFSAREALQGAPQPDPDIVLVDVDDKASAKWKNEPLSLWGPHFAAAFDRMSQGGVRLIALDILPNVSMQQLFSDEKPEERAAHRLFQQRNDALGAALQRVPDIVMIKEAAPAAPGQQPEWLVPAPELLYSARNTAPADMVKDGLPDPEWLLGYPELTSLDTIVAATSPTVEDKGNVESSFAARIVEHAYHTQGKRQGDFWSIPGKVAVPLRGDSSLLINYRSFTRSPALIAEGKDEAFAHYSLADIAEPAKEPDTRFKNKIVIVGASSKEFNDLHYIPFLQGAAHARSVSGPQIQANLVRTLLDGKPIREPEPVGIWLFSVALGLVGLLAFSKLRWGTAAGVCVLVAAAWIGIAFWAFARHDIALPVSLPIIGLLLAGGMLGTYRALGEERERQQVLALWGRYQNPRQVDYLLQHPEARGGEGQEATATVLFADLKNFTKTVEMLSPPEALRVLNRYLGLMAEMTDKHGGVVDKFLGDGLMAQWGMPWAPVGPDGDHAGAAVRACIEMQERIQQLTASISSDRQTTFGVRLTLHTGPVVVGWVGADRVEFTIIGDTVNVTSRLQETAKQLDVEFLISESTHDAVRDWVRTGQEAEVEIRGRQRPLKVYEVVAQTSPPADVAVAAAVRQ